MTKAKTTKRALLLSGLAVLVCVSMLIGSTFAWFTDEVVSANNIIKSGKLDVTMEWADGTTDPDNTVWTDASTGPIFTEDEIWEPGYVSVRHIKIANKGNLAFKYQVSIVANGEVSKLADVIDVYYVDPAKQVANREALTVDAYLGTLADVLDNLSSSASGKLLPENSDTITIALKMKETAGNEYQELSIGSTFSIKLLATQLTSEEDSFNDQYDKMATIDTEAELLEALAADYDLIQLGANITVTESIVIPAGKTVAIDLAGYTMSQEKGDITAAYALIDNKGTLTIEDSIGTGKISFADTTPYTADIGWASNTIRNTGVLTVNGGTVENLTSEAVMKFSYPHAIDCYQGSVTTINGGTVKSINYDAIRMFCNSETLATEVNISGGKIINRVSFQDPNSSKAGYGRLNISGGTFVTTEGVTANVRLLNFCNVSGNMKATVTGGTFDKGFKTQNYASIDVKTSDWLTFAGATAVASDAETLQEELDNAEDGAIIKLVADINGDVTATQKPDVKITIDGNGVTYAGSITVNGKSAAYDTAALTIQNINFNANGLSKDASINLGGNNAIRYVNHITVKDCTFTGVLADEKVGIKSYTGGDKNLTITGCTATGMHSLAQLYVTEGVIITDCTIKNSKNGISVRASTNVVISNCDIDVLAYGIRADGGVCTQTLNNNTITATQPVVVRKLTTAGYVLNLDGNTFTAKSADGYQVILTTGSDDVAYVAPTVSYTLNGADTLKVFQ